MWPFRKTPEQPAPVVDGDTYLRWLRSHRPPFDWFITQDPLKQEAMAALGDDYVEHCVAISQPEPPSKEESERDAMEAVAEQMARKIMQANPKVTSAGFKERAARSAEARKAAADSAKSFMGRQPDGVA